MVGKVLGALLVIVGTSVTQSSVVFDPANRNISKHNVDNSDVALEVCGIAGNNTD